MFIVTLLLNVLRGNMFDSFIYMITNFCSCKADVDFSIVCFNGIDIIRQFWSKARYCTGVLMILSNKKN